MKRFALKLIASAAVGLALIVLLLAATFAWQQVHIVDYQREAGDFTDRLLSDFCADWDPTQIIRRMSLHQKLTIPPEEASSFVDSLSHLGPIKGNSIPRLVDSRTVLTNRGFVFTATLESVAYFEEADATIRVLLIRRADSYRILGLQVIPVSRS